MGVHDYGREEGLGYIVMEYVEGAPARVARSRSPRSTAPSSSRARCWRRSPTRTAAASSTATSSPRTSCSTPRGQVKVTDFGIARLVSGDADPGITAVGRVVGTPRYLAPEALAGAAPDPRMDIYAVGIVLREMVTGPEPGAALPPALERIVGQGDRRPPRGPLPGARTRWRVRSSASARATAPAALDDLLPEQRDWLRAAALVLTLATAVALWALLLSVTPKVIAPGDVQPLIMLRTERLADGRILSRARFETWPTLAALGAIAVAVAAQGALRRHWRGAQLERPRPDRPLPESRLVLRGGIVSLSVYALRLLFEGRGFEWAFAYIPILGGVIEIAVVFLFWMAILQAWRASRPLRREWRLWVGALLALVPPVADLAAYVLTAH